MSTAPTVGRIVHYRTYDNERTEARCVPAMVTETHDGDDVGLFIAGPASITFDRKVRHDENQDDATWHWPCVNGETEEPPPAAYLP